MRVAVKVITFHYLVAVNVSWVAVNVSVVNISVALGSKRISCIVVQIDGTLVVTVVAVVVVVINSFKSLSNICVIIVLKYRCSNFVDGVKSN